MPHSWDMGHILLLRLRRKAYWGFSGHPKYPTASAGFEPANSGSSEFCELLWDASCTDFMEGMLVVDNFIGWITTNLQLMCHFISSHLSVLQDHAIDSFHVCIINGCGLAPSSSPMLNACATIFEPLDPFTDNPLWQDTAPILHWYHSMHFGTCGHLQPTEMDHFPLLFFGTNEIGVSIFMAQNLWQKWSIKVTPTPQWYERCRPCASCHAQPAV